MNTQFRKPGRATILAVAGLVLLAVLAARLSGNTAARAGSPPPDQPQFTGTAVTESLPLPELAARVPTPRQLRAGWEIYFSEDWEDGFDDAIWTTIDRNGGANGEYKWDVRAFENTLGGGAQSAWAVGGGQDGQNLDVADGGYPPGVDSWLIYGPFDLSNTADAELSFNYWFEADEGDTFSVLVSTNASSWNGLQSNNSGTGEWLARNFSLEEYAGAPEVYLAFRFASNDTGDPKKLSAFVDDIVIRVDSGSVQYLPHIQVMPSPTVTATSMPTATPTATPPTAPFFDDFTSDISGWEVRRSTVDSVFRYSHRDDSDGGRAGFLELQQDSGEAFFIVSPLVEAKGAPYTIEFYAKLKDTRDRHMYGVVFGADWDGGSCAAPMPTNCFSRYYELRVQYRNLNGDRFQELKLKRIDSHDSSGEPVGPTLFDWTRGGSVGVDDWAQVEVTVAADGLIRVFWNGNFINEARDATLLNQHHFGLMLIAKEKDDARVKYDFLRID